MSKENAISIEIPEAEITRVMELLNEVNGILDQYLVSLTPEQRRTIPKMADGSEPFVMKVLSYCKSDPIYCPPFLNVEELDKDFKVVEQLNPVYRNLNSLLDRVRDTKMLAGSESYVNSLSYYNSVKLAAKKNVGNAETVFDDLRKRFEANGKRKS